MYIDTKLLVMLAIYCRLSVFKEGDTSKSIENQKEYGIKFAKKNKMDYKVYIDKGISGGKAVKDRPAFQEMLDDIEKGLIDSISVWNQDRLAREETVWFALIDVMERENVTLYESGVKVDMEDEGVRTQKGMKAVWDASTRRRIGRDIRRSVRMNLEKGKAHGINAYGYTKDKEGYLVVKPDEAEVVKLILKLSLEGKGFVAIARELNKRGIPTKYQNLVDSGGVTTKDTYEVVDLKTKDVRVLNKKNVKWNPSTVNGIVNNRNYMGERIVHGITYKCPAIVSRDYFERVQANLAKNKNTKTGKIPEYKYLLNNLLVCGSCKYRISGRSNAKTGSTYLSYRCLNKRHHYSIKERCHQRDMLCDPLDYVIWQRLFIDKAIMESMHENFSYKNQQDNLDVLQAEIHDLNAAMTEAKTERKVIIQKVAKGVMDDDDVADFMRDNRATTNDLQSRIVAVKDKMDYIKTNQDNVMDMEQEIEQLKYNAPFDKKQEIIEKYIEKIELNYEDKAYYVKVFFKVDIPYELYVIDTKYNLALDGRSNTLIPISQKYIDMAKSPDGIFNDNILNRLAMKVINYDYGEKVQLFMPQDRRKLTTEVMATDVKILDNRKL